jgi:hypothetical protein
MPATFFRTTNGRWRALRFIGCLSLFSAAGALISRGFHALPWVAWLLLSAAAFMMSSSEADTPPAKSGGLILVYVVACVAMTFGVILLLVDLATHR